MEFGMGSRKKREKRGAGQKRGQKRAVSLLAALFLLFAAVGTAGCGASPAAEGGSAEGASKTAGEENGNQDTGEAGVSGEKVMGRYVETMNEALSGFLMAGSRIVQQEDGSLVIFSTHSGKWVSRDQGEVWEQDTPDWFDELKYVMSIAVSRDGNVAVICEDTEEEGGQEDEADTQFHPRYMVISPDNEIKEFEIPYKDSYYLRTLCFSDEGKLFASDLSGKVYEVDWEQGSYETVAELTEWASYLRVWDEKMVCVTYDGVYLYDLSAGEQVTDKALDEFVNANLKEKLEYADGYYQELLVIPDGEVMYLVCEKGIFRHVWGGNLVEQLADGSLNSLSDPSCAISDGMMLKDGTFLLIVKDGLLASYAYDPDMPATPDIQLKAYSLLENNRMKKAIADYQARHPEVYIRYETGMEANGSVTREDALKKLNTEIAAGAGPDLLLLDDLPMDSYIEKGILMDLTPYLEKEAGDGYFQNIIKAFETDGAIYAVPAEYKLPLIGGRAEEVERMTDLNAMAEIAEKYRSENPEGGIFGPVSEKSMIKQFLPVCAPVWRGEDGKADEEKLEEFFSQMQRIWNAEKEGVSDQQRKEEEDFYVRVRVEGGRNEEEADEIWIDSLSRAGEGYMQDRQAFFMGSIDGSFDFDLLNSYFHIKGKEDGGFASYGGQASGVFMPCAMVGINRMSEYQEIAAELMETMLNVNWGALVLNKEQLKENLRANANEDGSSYGSMGSSREDGTSVFLDIYPASEEEISRLAEIAEQAKVPYIRNRVLENAVCEAGEKVLKGEMTPKEGAQEVTKRVSLYMAE